MENVEFKQVLPRPAKAKVKYSIIEFLALKGFKAIDVVSLTPSSISVNKGKCIVTSNGKSIELTLEEAKILTGYMVNNRRSIDVTGLLFSSKEKQTTEINLHRSLKTHLKDYSSNTMETLGWTEKGIAIPNVIVNSMDDIGTLLTTFKTKKTTV